jgi:hypothetical protein
MYQEKSDVSDNQSDDHDKNKKVSDGKHIDINEAPLTKKIRGNDYVRTDLPPPKLVYNQEEESSQYSKGMIAGRNQIEKIDRYKLKIEKVDKPINELKPPKPKQAQNNHSSSHSLLPNNSAVLIKPNAEMSEKQAMFQYNLFDEANRIKFG